MTPAIRGLVPIAIALLVAGAIIAWLIGEGSALGTWLLAAFLLGHGWVHMMYLVPRPADRDPTTGAAPGSGAAPADPAPFPFDLGRSWLTSRVKVKMTLLRGLGRGLAVATTIAFALAALATVGLLVPTDWWAGLVIVASILSMVLMAIFFDVQLLLGFAIDLVLLVIAMTGVWSPAAA